VNYKDELAQKKAATEQRYRAVLEVQAKEGLSREEAASRAGVKPSTLTWWASELARRERERLVGSASSPAAPVLVPVRVHEADAEPVAWTVKSAASTPYEVVLVSGRVLRVPRDFDAVSVQALVRAVEAAPC
jgi:hypothetical protein